MRSVATAFTYMSITLICYICYIYSAVSNLYKILYMDEI